MTTHASFHPSKFRKPPLRGDKLIRSIRRFEKNPPSKKEYLIDPSPDVVYQCQLEYLAKICELISIRFRDLSLMIRGEEMDY